VSPDGSVRVRVPAGAVTETATLRFGTAPGPAAALTSAASAAAPRVLGRPAGSSGTLHIFQTFELTASTAAGRPVTTFAEPVAISARYDAARAAQSGVAAQHQAIYVQDPASGTWEYLPSHVDTAAGLVHGETEHFSVFAIGGETFETAGVQATANSFQDIFADLNAWTIASGTGTVAANTLTSGGANGTNNLFTLDNSSAYKDFTYEAMVSDGSKNNSHRVGLVFRALDLSNGYQVVLHNDRVDVEEVVAGTRAQLQTNAFTYTAGTFYWLKVVTNGTSITASIAADSSGSPGVYTNFTAITDASFASGLMGLTNFNESGGTRTGRFQKPRVSIVLPADWNAIIQTTGRPGVIWDRTTAAHGGTGSLQIFSGDGAYQGYSAQTTNNTVLPGVPYSVTGWIKTTSVSTGGSDGAQVQIIELPSNTTTNLNTKVTGTTAWTQFTLGSLLQLQDTTTSVQVRVFLQGSGTANFDDIAFASALKMTISTITSAFGAGLAPDGVTSDQAVVGVGYTDATGAYYVRDRNGSAFAVMITVRSSKAWDGNVLATENSGTAGATIAGGSLRWKLGDLANLTDAQAGTAFSTTSNTSVFTTASSCLSGSAKQPGTCTFNYDYSLRVLWTDTPGTFSSSLTYTAITS